MTLQQQQMLLVAMPFIFSYIGTTVAAILAQPHFPEPIREPANALIAWGTVLVCAALSAYVAGSITTDMAYGTIIQAIVGAATALLSGGLASLKPYLFYLDFVKMNLGNVVKPAPVPALAVSPVSKVSSAVLPGFTQPKPFTVAAKPLPPRQDDQAGDHSG